MDKAETVEGTVNSVKENDYLKIDGTTYNYNYAYTVDSVLKGYDKAKGLYDLDASEGANPEAGNDATIYLDTYGNAIAIEKTDVSVDDYLYVKGTDEAYNEVSAKVVFSDGTEGTIDIDELNGTPVKNQGEISKDTVYKFSKSGSDYDLTSVNKITDRTGTQVTKDLVITKESASFTGYIGEKGETSESFSANSNTVYVDVDNNKVFTGYRNVPGMTSASGGYVVEKNGIAEIVFLKDAGKYDVDDDSFFFVKSTSDVTVVDTEDGKFYEWTVFVNGVKETLTLTSSANSEIKDNGVGMYSIESTDKHDYVEDVDFQVSGTDLKTSYAEYAEKELLKLSSTAGDKAMGSKTVFAYDNDTTFFVVELKNGKPDGDNIYAGSVNSIETDADGRTGVCVLNVEDKNTSKTPLATLVLVIVPDEDTTSGGNVNTDGSVDVSLTLSGRELSMSVDNYVVDGQTADNWNGSNLTVTVAQTVNGGTPYTFEDSVKGSFSGLANTVNGLIGDALRITNVGSGNTIEVEVVVSFTGGNGVTQRSFSGSDIIIT